MTRSISTKHFNEIWRAAALSLAVATIALSVAGCGDDSNPVSVNSREFSVVEEETFSVSVETTPFLDLNNFVGNVTVIPGTAAGLMRVTATKYAAVEADLDKISLNMGKIPGGVNINATNPNNAENVSVDLLIEAPTSAKWELTIGIGNIVFEGRPAGQSSFTTSVGNVDLTLPQNINTEINLSAGAGTVSCQFQVEGQVTSNLIFGKIGSGVEGSISASTGVGRVVARY